jgi:CoA:oxalate CoA-transferase
MSSVNYNQTSNSHLDPDKPKTLEGITVIDFTHVLAGPTCTMMLADQGARVIKIERPGTGDDTREMGPFYQNGDSIYYAFPNRGKESIALNLKDPEDMALVRRMIAKADVVVENFCPGTMARLGLDPQKLVKDHPRLIVCSISGFGQYGPMHQKAAYDTVIQAISGIMDLTGFPSGPATRVGTSIADLVAGIYGFCGILSALYVREKSGKGTTVDVAMLDSVFALTEHGLMDAIGEHIKPNRLGNRHPFMYPFDTFNCKDRPVAITVGNDKLFASLCDALGIAECITDERVSTNVNRCENHAPLKAIMEKALSTKTAAEWCKIFDGAGVPCDFILNIYDTRNLDQINVRGMVREVAGKSIPGSPIKFGEYYSLATTVPPPDLNADGERIRKEFSPQIMKNI